MVKFGNDWDELLKEEFQKDYYKALREFLKYEYANYTIFPDMWHIFDALKATPCSEVKVVILGQDPYHGLGQAHGLAFSVMPGTEIPPSLQNIYKELSREGYTPPRNGCLTGWAKQGVLLLNTVLTVRGGRPLSHREKGWEKFTKELLRIVSEVNREKALAYMLWGREAESRGPENPGKSHLILKAPHPSPLSAHRGFIGCNHFMNANCHLVNERKVSIDWSVTEE